MNAKEEWNYGCDISDLQFGKEIVGNIYENQDILKRRRIYGEEYKEGFERTNLFYPHQNMEEKIQKRIRKKKG